MNKTTKTKPKRFVVSTYVTAETRALLRADAPLVKMGARASDVLEAWAKNQTAAKPGALR